MRLTKTTSHAIRILIECAGANGELINTTSIARRLNMTPLHVLKIVHHLSVSGFVDCARGRNGGVRLARSAGSIRIGEVVRTMEFAKRCMAAPGLRSNDHEVEFESIFDDALEAFIGVLDQHSLADMSGECLTLSERPVRKQRAAANAKSTVAGD
jgi:Rrf2 family nitric oxide-sensitive transcriptional repressor